MFLCSKLLLCIRLLYLTIYSLSWLTSLRKQILIKKNFHQDNVEAHDHVLELLQNNCYMRLSDAFCEG